MDKKSIKKYLLNVAVILLVGGLSIYFSIGSQLNSTIDSLKNCNIWWLIVVFVLMAIHYLINAMNLTVFARVYKKDYKLSQGIINSLAGVFFNGITPMASGGQFYQVYAFNKQGIKATFSSSILLMVFIVYQSVLVFYTTIIMILRFSYFNSIYSGFFSLAIVGFIINLVVISSLFLGAKSKKLQDFFCNKVIKVLAKLHIVKNYYETKTNTQRKLEGFRIELALLQKNRPVLFKSILLNIFKLTILYSIPFFCGKAMGVDLTWNCFLDLIGITSFVYMISDFVPLPGASGGSEGTFYILLNVFLKGATSATLLVWRFSTYYFGLIVGGLAMSFSKELHMAKKTIVEEKEISNDLTEESNVIQDIVIEDIDEIGFDDFKR